MMMMHFPAALTEEEESLKQAFARLKKKKKMVQALKAGTLNQEKEATHNKGANKQASSASMPRDKAKATEQAKRLVQSGAIKLTSAREKSGFKRSKNFTERKLDTEVKGPGVGFQPFMAYNAGEEDGGPAAKRVKGLNESFVSAGYGNRSFDRPDRERTDRPGGAEPAEKGGTDDKRERDRERDFRDRERDYRDREPPKKGNTVFVHGVGVTEELMRKTFHAFGKIINVAMETERNKAFITFEKTDSADQAINQVNGSMVNNTQLRVSMARHQPSVETLSDASSSASWASIAASSSQKASTTGGCHKDKRRVVEYDQDDIF